MIKFSFFFFVFCEKIEKIISKILGRVVKLPLFFGGGGEKGGKTTKIFFEITFDS